MEDENKTEYEKHNVYVISNGKVSETINELGFNINNLIYLYDKDYNVKVYDTDFNLLFTVKLDEVKKINKISLVSNNIIKLELENKIIQFNYVLNNEEEANKYYDKLGNEVTFNEGELVYRNDEYVAYIKDNKTLNVLDNEGNLLDSISGSKITVKGNFAIVDNGIYEIVKKEN